MIKSISLLAAVLTAGTCALPYPLTQTCPAPSSIGGAQATIGGKPYSGCLPSWCFTSNVVDASTQACSFDAISCDYALAVKNIGCKQCTQSTQPKCSTANLTAAIMGTTVKAACVSFLIYAIHILDTQPISHNCTAPRYIHSYALNNCCKPTNALPLH